MPRTHMAIEDESGRAVCESCAIADSPLARMRGLLGRRGLEPHEGLLLRPAPSVHTWFMRFPIDAVFLSRDLDVLSVRRMPAWRMAAQRGARAVLELRAGEAARRGLVAGSRLRVTPPSPLPTSMASEYDGVRRVDVGAGIYVRVTRSDQPAPPDDAPLRSASRRVPMAALLGGAVLAAASVVRLGVNPHGLMAAGLLAVLTVLAAIDVRARVLPNRILGPTLAAALAWQLVFVPDRALEFLLAGLGAGGLMLLPSLLRPGAVGMGDVKLAALLGVALGADVVGALMIAFLSAAPVALYLLLRGRAGAAMPYGPFLALGAAVVLLA